MEEMIMLDECPVCRGRKFTDFFKNCRYRAKTRTVERCVYHLKVIAYTLENIRINALCIYSIQKRCKGVAEKVSADLLHNRHPQGCGKPQRNKLQNAVPDHVGGAVPFHFEIFVNIRNSHTYIPFLQIHLL